MLESHGYYGTRAGCFHDTVFFIFGGGVVEYREGDKEPLNIAVTGKEKEGCSVGGPGRTANPSLPVWSKLPFVKTSKHAYWSVARSNPRLFVVWAPKAKANEMYIDASLLLSNNRPRVSRSSARRRCQHRFSIEQLRTLLQFGISFG